MHFRQIFNHGQVRLSRSLLTIIILGIFIFCFLKVFDQDNGKSDIFFDLTDYSELQSSVKNIEREAKPLKTILWYNDPHFIITDTFGSGHQPFVQHNCPVSDCALYTEPTQEIPMKDYDAVIFRAVRLRNMTTKAVFDLVTPDLNKRSPHQRYIFYDLEPPLKMRMVNWELYANFYNWTMTYKKDSDIWMPYGKIDPVPNVNFSKYRAVHSQNAREISSFIKSKTKLVAWFVSHCLTDSARELYVQHLKKHVPVDIYGNCGNMTCPRIEGTHYSEEECYEMVEKTYKFYLSFENSFCSEYVTEKLFSIMKHNIVPIVYGSADYDSILPKHSYINALDYTPQGLAKYVKYLDRNNTAYQEYFWWKPYYKLYADWNVLSPMTMCKLCEKLHEPLVPKSIADMGMLQGTNTNCLLRPEVLRYVGKGSIMFKEKLGPAIRNAQLMHRSLNSKLFHSKEKKHFLNI